nr:translation initiation factor eIF-2B subunit alpha [Andalucia godoyi]|eukprot:ANDGO_05564.mRNA.1 Translation initiation factor eIF-2B subunit alpha
MSADVIFDKHCAANQADPVAINALRTMAEVCASSTAATMMGIYRELNDAMRRILTHYSSKIMESSKDAIEVLSRSQSPLQSPSSFAVGRSTGSSVEQGQSHSSLDKALRRLSLQQQKQTGYSPSSPQNDSIDYPRFLSETLISVSSACTLFIRFITRILSSVPESEFSNSKATLPQRGEKWTAAAASAHKVVGTLVDPFFRSDNTSVLVHGHSRAVLVALENQLQKRKRFTVYVTECHPFQDGEKMVKALEDRGIVAKLVRDCAVFTCLQKVDFVLAGAEAVVENGGVISRVGTAQVAVVAGACGKPFYVAAESWKFTRVYPLSQEEVLGITLDRIVKEKIRFGVEDSAFDYTSPDKITLLFTDLGVLTPSAVSDELIKLYV